MLLNKGDVMNENPLSLPANDSAAWFFVPAGVAALTTVTSRLTAGLLGGSAKIGGKVAKAICLENFGNGLDNAGNKLISFATKSPKNEINAILFWTTLGMGAYGGTSINVPSQSVQPSGQPVSSSWLPSWRPWGSTPPTPAPLQSLPAPWEHATTYLSQNSELLALIPAGVQLVAVMLSGNSDKAVVSNEAQKKEELIEPSKEKKEKKKKEEKTLVETTVNHEASVEFEETHHTEEKIENTIPTLIGDRIFISRKNGSYVGGEYKRNNTSLAHGQGTFLTFDQIKYDGEFHFGFFVKGTINDEHGTVNFQAKDMKTFGFDSSESESFEETVDTSVRETKKISTQAEVKKERVKVRIGTSMPKGDYEGEHTILGFPGEKFAHGQGTFKATDGKEYSGTFANGKFMKGTITEDGQVEEFSAES